MKVNNKKCVRKIATRCLLSNKRRNVITIAAIALTAILFTTLFTIVLSLNASFETSTFRQLGGKNHGTFKAVSDDELDILKENRHIKAYGERRIAGICAEVPFTKQSAEISYMDENCTEWSFVELKEGRLPEAYNEVIMDTEVLRLLGKEPVLGEEIEISFNINGLTEESAKVTDTFVLVGYWEFDSLSPAHYINVSKEYVDKFNEKIVQSGYNPIRTDFNVMFSSSFDVVSKMQRVEVECGFDPDDARKENYVSYGVNPGYVMSDALSEISLDTVLPILAFSLLVMFTGYLIIYNVFQISVVTDIRFFGLLKTIGTTKKQIKRLIRDQALFLCIIAIPIGLVLGYFLGVVLMPYVLTTSTVSLKCLTMSTSPVIFIGAAVFEVITVLISVSKPGRMASKVSPVEALRYTQATGIRKKKKATKGAKVTKMAFANMERNKKKTILVFISIALSLVILNVVNMFVGGFDSEKWLNSFVSTDFVVGSVRYFKFQGATFDDLPIETVDYIKENVNESAGGFGYDVAAIPLIKVNDALYEKYLERTGESIEYLNDAGSGMHDLHCVAEGMDDCLLDKLVVFEGDVSLLKDPSKKCVAIMTGEDSYGNLYLDENVPKIGETISFSIAEKVEAIDKTTGEVPDDMAFMDPENIVGRYTGLIEGEYTVCAYVGVPTGIGPRRGTLAYDLVFGKDTLKEIAGDKMVPMFYAFDTASDEDEEAAEAFVSKVISDSDGMLEYESKAVKRAEFDDFKNMFILIGGVLCLIIGFVGVLNFFNTIMASIISRKNELAILQAIGMTGKQVKKMLIIEGLIYTVGAGAIALLLSLAFTPLINLACENMFWFYLPHFSVMPFAYVMPVIAILGFLVPLMIYKKLSKASIVERIREIE